MKTAIEDKIHTYMNSPDIILPFLSIGRLVYIKKQDKVWGWGVSLNFNKKKMTIKSKKK